MEPFASLSDVLSRAKPSEKAALSTPEGIERATWLLEDASDLIRYRCPGWKTAPVNVLKLVVARVVLRAMRQRPAGVADDASSATQTTGPFSMSTSWASPSGDVFLTKQDRDDINGATSAFFGCADTLFGGQE